MSMDEYWQATTASWEISPFTGVISTMELYNRIDFLESVSDDGELPGIGGHRPGEKEELSALKSLAIALEQRKAKAELRTKDLDIIRDTALEGYFMDEAESLYGTRMSFWPFTCVNWEQAARERLKDYNKVQFCNASFYIHK